MGHENLRARVLDLFYVDLDNGILIRRRSINRFRAGDVPGMRRADGYVQISIDDKHYLLHRLLVLVRDGQLPEQVDHINGNKTDNRSCNLRAANAAINSQNQSLSKANRYGMAGIRYRSERDCFEAYWGTSGRDRKHKCFSCKNAGGYESAKRLAIEYRKKMITELNAQGARYTPDHGVRKAA